MRHRKRPFFSRGICVLLCIGCLFVSGALGALADAPKTALTSAQAAQLQLARNLIEERLEAMEEEGRGHGMARALSEWMRGNASVSVEKDGAVYIEIARPAFAESYPGLPVYVGLNPIEYMQKWHTTMRELLGKQRAAQKLFRHDTREELTVAAFDAWMVADVQPALDNWVWSGLNRTKAIPALSRMALSVQSGVSRIQAKQFVKSNQVDFYSTKKSEDHASNLMLYWGRAADLEQDLVRRWWPVYRGSLRHIEWKAPSDGMGPVLCFSAPRTTFALSEAVKSALVTGYVDSQIKREEAAKVVTKYAEELLATWPEQRFEKMSLTVNLIAFAEHGPMDAYLAFGVEPMADALAQFALQLEKSNDYFVEYARAHIPPQPYPKTTALLRPAAGLSSLNIRNEDMQEAVYVKIYRMTSAEDTGKGEFVGAVFVRPGQKASISIKPGYYHLNYARGKNWYGEEYLFGEEGHYISAAENTYCERGYALSITVAPSNKRKGKTAQLGNIGFENM